jgi:hypothetical protein
MNLPEALNFMLKLGHLWNFLDKMVIVDWFSIQEMIPNLKTSDLLHLKIVYKVLVKLLMKRSKCTYPKSSIKSKLALWWGGAFWTMSFSHVQSKGVGFPNWEKVSVSFANWLWKSLQLDQWGLPFYYFTNSKIQ